MILRRISAVYVCFLCVSLFISTAYAQNLDLQAPDISQINHESNKSETISEVITVTVTDNVAVSEVALHIRSEDEANYQKINMSLKDANTYSAKVPLRFKHKESIHYYFEATDLEGNTRLEGGPFSPLTSILNRIDTIAQSKSILTVNVEPETARIRIMNIKPQYKPGIELDKGRQYDIFVTQNGYKSWRKMVQLNNSEEVISVVLDKQAATNNPRMDSLASETSRKQTTASLDDENLFWDSVRDSGEAELYQAYLDVYPSGKYSALAKFHISKLKKSANHIEHQNNQESPTEYIASTALSEDIQISSKTSDDEFTLNNSNTGQRFRASGSGYNLVVRWTGKVLEIEQFDQVSNSSKISFICNRIFKPTINEIRLNSKLEFNQYCFRDKNTGARDKRNIIGTFPTFDIKSRGAWSLGGAENLRFTPVN